ncbi:MAG: S41 family peptidase [Leptonema sp. (in: bacteria)]
MKIKNFFLSLFLVFIYLSFSGCESAESRNIPKNFSLNEFDEVINYAISNYYDPKSINVKRAYIGATEAALKSLPYSLTIYPEEYYKNIEKYVKKERILPGKVIKISSENSYVIIEPNYKKLKEENKLKEMELKQKKLSIKERLELSRKLQEELKEEQKFLEEKWKKTSFSREDFLKVVQFIKNNLEKYKVPPKTEEDKEMSEYAKDFGMHYVYYYATNGFLSTFDPHSGLIDLSSWEKMKKESEDSSFEGIGAILRGGGTLDVIVETPLPGSPAVNAGLKAGDIIRKVNGESVENLSLNEVVKKIRGPKDTFVELEIERKSEMRTLILKIKRGIIEQKSVSSQYIPETPYKDFISSKIGIIKLSSFLFDKQTPSELIRKEYDSLLEKAKGKLEGLVIDLRNNPGGDLDEAIKVAGLFLPENSVVVEIRGKGNSIEKRRNPVTPIVLHSKETPIIVLINSNSASASEIFASALMDHNMGLIVGERSFGKATVQGLRKLGNVILKLTTARYYAPLGYTIQVYGVEPDIQISEEMDGSFSPRFREEDMWKHLPELEKKQPDPKREKWIGILKRLSIEDIKKAEDYLQQHSNDAIKPDIVLVRALAYINALKQYPTP